MASPITKKLREKIETHVTNLLGRGKYAFPCPLGAADQRTFWHSTFDSGIVQAYLKLYDQGFDMAGLTYAHARFEHWVEGRKFSVKFVQDFPLDRSRGFLMRKGETSLGSDTVTNALADTGITYSDFATWCENCAKIDERFTIASATIRDILDFCGTVGQLKRAVPDLVRYMPAGVQQELSEQVRASNMPHEWAKYDRTRVDTLEHAMATAHLMPKRSREGGWNEVDPTWCKYGWLHLCKGSAG